MIGPPRLKDEGGLGADLLRAADGDGPGPGARAAAAAALGLGITAAATGSTAAAATGSTATAPIAPAAVAAKVGVPLAIKAALGVTAAIGVGVGVHQVVKTNVAPVAQVERAPTREVAPTPAMPTVRTPAIAAPQPPAPVAPPVVTAAPHLAPVAPTPHVERAPLGVSETEQAPPAVVEPAPAPAVIEPTPIKPPVASTLRDEIALIDRALAALQRHDTTHAREALDEYERAFPAGTMAPEAQVARIQLSIATGDLATARALAAAFLAAHSTSPLAPRVRDLIRDHATP